MKNSLDYIHDTELFNQNVFLRLVEGLNAYLAENRLKIPDSLRYVLNVLSFTSPTVLPKTLHEFIKLSHTPVNQWYILPIPETFNSTQPLLYENRLSAEAQNFYFDMTECLQLSPKQQDDIPQTALDNQRMQELRTRLKTMPDVEAAQALYQKVRRFLIENSWTTSQEMRNEETFTFRELRAFYDEMPHPPDTLRVCERCGLLIWRDGQWQGIKPDYCSDHADDSPYVATIPKKPQLYRLKEGTHLRTFIPGRIELALFESAEDAQERYPEQLCQIEYYPGIDTYDMRLTFRDTDIWAVDAKDQANPKRLAQQIQLPYGEGNLAYTHAFFVIPDSRAEEDSYVERLERAVGLHPNHLAITTLSAFKNCLEEKLTTLAKPRRSKRNRSNNGQDG